MVNTKTKPTKPPVRSHIPYREPRPLQQPYQLHSAPKPGQASTGPQDATEAEYAAFGRAFLSLDSQERKIYQRLLTTRQKKSQLVAEMVAKVGGDVEVEPCNLCGFVRCVCEK